MKDEPQLTVLDLAKLADQAYDEPLPYTVLGAPTTIFNDDATDTQGYCVTLTLEGLKVVIIVFRGSKGAADWIRDSLLLSCRYKNRGRKNMRVHATATASWNSVSQQVIGYVRQATPNRVLITGHSLGGQLCTPCADELYSQLGQFSTRVTFGALPFGKAAFAEYMQDAPYLKHLRFVVGKDIAAFNFLHQGLFGYRHEVPAINLTPWWDMRRVTAHGIKRYRREIAKDLAAEPTKWRLI